MKTPIKRVPTFFLKAVIVLIGIAVLALCSFFFPQLWFFGILGVPEQYWAVYYSAITGLYLTLIPFLLALIQGFKLLHYIDKNNAFSELSINALRTIKFCAIAMSILYAVGMPLAVTFADIDDAPGVVLIAFAIVCAPLVVATFAAVLQKLVRSAVDLKQENDLTV